MSTLDHCQTTSVHRQTTSEHRLVQDHGDRQRLSDTATRSSPARSRRLGGPSDSAVCLHHGVRPGVENFCHAGVVQLSATLRNSFQSSEATILHSHFNALQYHYLIRLSERFRALFQLNQKHTLTARAVISRLKFRALLRTGQNRLGLRSVRQHVHSCQSCARTTIRSEFSLDSRGKLHEAPKPIELSFDRYRLPRNQARHLQSIVQMPQYNDSTAPEQCQHSY